MIEKHTENIENNSKHVKLGPIFWIVVIIIFLWWFEDGISSILTNNKINNILKEISYYVEASFEDAEILDVNYKYYIRLRQSVKSVRSSITVKLLNNNKKIRVPILADPDWKASQYKNYINREVKLCKLIYHSTKNKKVAQEYTILLKPDSSYYFDNRGIRFIYNAYFNDVVQLNVSNGIWYKIGHELIEVSEQNKDFYESMKLLKSTYESNYGKCYIYYKDNKWYMFLDHPEEYNLNGNTKRYYGILFEFSKEYSKELTTQNVVEKFKEILPSK